MQKNKLTLVFNHFEQEHLGKDVFLVPYYFKQNKGYEVTIVYPLTEAFIVTPVAPHSLTQRPLVMPVDFEIEFKVTKDTGAVVIIDGQELYDLNKDEIIKIKIATKKSKMLHRSSRDFFEVLSEKLRWGN